MRGEPRYAKNAGKKTDQMNCLNPQGGKKDR